MSEDRASHRHPRTAMPLFAGINAYITVDALAEVTNQNFPQELPSLLALLIAHGFAHRHDTSYSLKIP
jgi:hypothetical protein